MVRRLTKRIWVVSVLFPFGQVVSARFLGWVVSAQLGRVVSAQFHRWVVSARFLGWVVSAWFIYNGKIGKISGCRQKLKNSFPFGKFRLLTTLYNCHTSYCKQCSFYILKVGNEFWKYALKAQGTPQSLVMVIKLIIRYQRNQKSEERQKNK